MNRVLWKLYWLTIKGTLRSLGRKFVTVRGALLSLVTLGFFGMLLVQSFFMLFMRSRIPFTPSTGSELLAGLLPLGMLTYFVLSVTPAIGEKAIQFSASEIDFLFPAPFSRRQLLAFYVLRGLVGKLILSIIVAVSMAMIIPSIWSASVGLFVSLLFLHGATIAAQFVQQSVSTQLYSRTRQMLMALLLLSVALGLASAVPTGTDVSTFFAEFRSNAAVRAVSIPFGCFSRIILAPHLPDHVFPDLTVALALNVLVYGLIFKLDSRYEDMAVHASQKRYERMQAAQHGNMYVGVLRRSEYQASSLPAFPWWHGVGPNLRRQFVSGLRGLRHMIGLWVLMSLVGAGIMIMMIRQNPRMIDYVGYIIPGITLYITFLLSAQLPFGFRGDLNHMEVLKSLPIAAFAIVTSEVIGAAAIVCFGQWLLIVVAILGAPSQGLILLSAAAFYIPFNLLLLGNNNLMLLLFPYRLASGSPDVTLMGRVMILMAATLFTFMLSCGIAAIPASVAYLITASWAVAGCLAWITLMTLGIGQLFAIAWAFRRFDVSRDMPD